MIGCAVLLLAALVMACGGGSKNSQVIPAGESVTVKPAAQAAPAAPAPTVAPETDFSYDLAAGGKGVKIREYTGNTQNLVVPSTIEGLPVVEIGEKAFVGKYIVSVILPDTVTKLGQSVFGDNGASSWLTSVTLSKNITEIPAWTFGSCSVLKEVVLPNGITTIGDSAFFGCASLTSLVLPNSVTTIESMAFSLCSELRDLTVPDSIKRISRGEDYLNTFEGCGKLTLAARSKLQELGYKGSF
jgi:hypothetical protein